MFSCTSLLPASGCMLHQDLPSLLEQLLRALVGICSLLQAWLGNLQCTAPFLTQPGVQTALQRRQWMYCCKSARSKLKGMQDKDAVFQRRGSIAVAGGFPAKLPWPLAQILTGSQQGVCVQTSLQCAHVRSLQCMLTDVSHSASCNDTGSCRVALINNAISVSDQASSLCSQTANSEALRPSIQA